MITLRTLTHLDVPLVLQLTEQAGWNQLPDDVRRFLAMQPDGCFLAEWQTQPAGTVATFEFGGIAWVAMVLVDASLRGRGIGRALMNQALDHLECRGIQTIRLDATPLGLPLYEKLGFVSQFTLNRFAGTPIIPSDYDTSTPNPIEFAAADDFNAILDLDRGITHTDRQKLLMCLFQEHRDRFRVHRDGSALLGFATSRPGAQAVQIGPCIGTRSGGRLLADALRLHTGQRVYVDVPTDHRTAVELCESFGLVAQRQLTRMTRGPLVIEQQEGIWAGSGPEKG